MIWLTWRQHRTDFVLMGGGLVMLTIILGITGQQMASAYQQLGVSTCLTHTAHPSCANAINIFQQHYGNNGSSLLWLDFIPGFIGMLVGAPLVARELEQGTQQMIWTQSMSRTHWLLVKLGILLGATLLFMGMVTILLTWWNAPLDSLDGHLIATAFDFEGIVPFGYGAFALLLGIAAGTILRRTLPAMAVAMLGFLGVRFALLAWGRSHYMPPLTTLFSPTSTTSQANGPGSWVIDRGWSDMQGHHIADSTVYSLCNPQQSEAIYQQCIQQHGWLRYNIFQPDDRFWIFQSIEMGIFLMLAALLFVLTLWWIRRRIV